VLSLERRCALSELGSPKAREDITSLCERVKVIFYFFNPHLFFSPPLELLKALKSSCLSPLTHLSPSE